MSACTRKSWKRGLLRLGTVAACSISAGRWAPAQTPPNPPSGAPERRALIVGVSDYKSAVPPRKALDRPNLASHLDTRNIARVLVERWGFRPENVLILLDQHAYLYSADLFHPVTGIPQRAHALKGSPYNATKQGIQTAWREFLLARSKPGDVVFASFSGHGEQLKDDGNDESDGLDEAFVPYDFVGSGEQNARADLRDDEIFVMLTAMAARVRPRGGPQGSVTAAFDCCHTGTISRGGDTARSTFTSTSSVTRAGRKGAVRKAGLLTPDGSGYTDGAEEGDGYVVLSACQSGESTYEYRPDRRSEGGVFTYKLCEALRRVPAGATYRDLFDTLTIGVKMIYPYQTPALFGNPGQRLFGAETLPDEVYPSVQADSDFRNGALRLNFGEIHGLTTGSEITLYRSDSRLRNPEERLRFDGKPVHAIVRSTGIGECSAEIVDPALRAERYKPMLLGSRAVVTRWAFQSDPLRVLLVNLPQLRPLLLDETLAPDLDAIQVLECRTLQQVRSERFDVYFTLETVGPDKGQKLRIRHTDDSLIEEVAWPMLPADQATLRSRLVNVWRRRLIYGLRQPVSTGALGLAMDVETSGPRRELQGTLQLRLGDPFRFVIRNTGTRPVWVNLLNLQPDGKLALVFPMPGFAASEEIAPGKSLVLPLRVRTPVGHDLFKVIGTSSRLDLPSLVLDPNELAAARGRGVTGPHPPDAGAPASQVFPLQQLFWNSTTARRSRGEQPADPAYWTTTEIRIQTNPKTSSP